MDYQPSAERFHSNGLHESASQEQNEIIETAFSICNSQSYQLIAFLNVSSSIVNRKCKWLILKCHQ